MQHIMVGQEFTRNGRTYSVEEISSTVVKLREQAPHQHRTLTIAKSEFSKAEFDFSVQALQINAYVDDMSKLLADELFPPGRKRRTLPQKNTILLDGSEVTE